MNTEELLVHDGCKRKAVERLHTTIVDCFRILDFTCECVCVCVCEFSNSYLLHRMLTLQFEGEVLCEMSTLMVSSQ